MREAAQFIGLGGRGPVLVGAPAQVVDQLEAWMESTGIDGFNLAYALPHEDMQAVVEWIVPELQRRGRYRPVAAATSTLRDSLLGAGARLPDTHPGRQVRIAGLKSVSPLRPAA